MIIRCEKGADANFLQRVLSSPRAIAAIEDTSVGTTIINLNQGTLIGLTIQFPPEAEQRAIATALSDVDALLGGLERLIAKKRDLKQAAMQQLITGQTRLPGFVGAGFKPPQDAQDPSTQSLDLFPATMVGLIPRAGLKPAPTDVPHGWEVKRVAQFGQIVTGGTPLTEIKEFWGEGYPWVTPTDISSRRDMFESERSLTRLGLSAIRALPANTVLVTCIASIGKNAILKSGGGCNQQINAVIPNVASNAEFLYYLFEASKQYLLANAGTTATSIISKAVFSELEFKVPPLPEQVAIAAVLTDMDAGLALLTQRLEKTRDLKQGMMQELLTGRTRLM